MKKRFLLIVLFTAFAVFLASCVDLRAQDPYQSPHSYEELRIQMIKEVQASVVAVKTETGHGSGVIYKSENLGNGMKRYYIMTNYHVIEDAGEMTIHFGVGKEEIPVKDVAGLKAYDIAVVRIDTDKVLRVHSSKAIDDNTRVEIVKGQDVYAIGTPQDINKFNYVTQGIVSMSTFTYNGIPELALMHDAELNPGNSGGPLFNLRGDLIGINVAKVAVIPTADGNIAAEGLNYALNINKIAPIVRSFVESDFSVVERRPRLGVTVQEVEVFLDPANGNDPGLLPDSPVGVIIIGLDPSRDAYGKLEAYDLIIRMNGIQISSIADIGAQLADAEFGDVHQITVLRKQGETFVEVTVNITLS